MAPATCCCVVSRFYTRYIKWASKSQATGTVGSKMGRVSTEACLIVCFYDSLFFDVNVQ